MTTKTKAKSGQRSAVSDQQVISIPLEKLHNHPANPDPTEAEILKMVDWLTQSKQLEPITVRKAESGKRKAESQASPSTLDSLPLGHYQVLAGKTRLAAANRLDWDALGAIVRELDEAAAIEVLAGTNQQRRTETPIRQALMIEAMIEAGKSLLEAGAMYDLKTEAAVRNKLTLLRLPDVWQQRVISGEMPESGARMLCPYVDHPTLLDHFDADYRQTMASKWPDEKVAWTDRDSLKETLQSIIHEKTRPVEAGDRYYDHGEASRYFELDEITEASLDIVRAPLGKNGAIVRRAINVELYDQLNAPFLDQRKNGSRTKKNAGGKSTAKKPTPAQQSAIDREKKQKADKKTAEAVHAWKYRFLRMMMAGEIKSGSYVTTLLLPWLMSHVRTRRNEYGTDPAPLNEYLRAAATIVAGENNRCPGYKPDKHSASLINLISNDSLDDEITCSEDIQAMLLRFLLWPQCEARPRSLERLLSVDPPQAWRPMSAKDRSAQVFLLVIDDRDIDTLVRLMGVSIAEGWKRGAIGGSRERRMIDEFFQLHTRPQLNELAGELLGTTSSEATQIADQKRSSGAVALLHDAHTSKRPLPLPKSLGKAESGKRKAESWEEVD